METSHEIAVFELGTNFPGEIFTLSDFLKPDHGVITNIGHSHLENLKSLEGVVNEKSDLFLNVKNHGSCIARVENKFRKIITKKSEGKKLTLLSKTKKDIFSTNFDISFQCITNALGLKISTQEKNKLKKLLSEKVNVSGRMERKIGPKKTTFLDDTYNANPDSFLAAFEEISSLDFKEKNLCHGENG